ncbi:MAG: hypothetical protein IIV78_07005, partial [Oscillospiraceae bacterium]|nr:hypothetical protein [Oscillospiraceae bacterium]
SIMFRSVATFGRLVGATPDGRPAQAPLCDSLAAIFGKDDKGPTALYVGKNGATREEAAVAVANAVAAEMAKDGPTNVYVKNGRAVRGRSGLVKN